MLFGQSRDHAPAVGREFRHAHSDDVGVAAYAVFDDVGYAVVEAVEELGRPRTPEAAVSCDDPLVSEHVAWAQQRLRNRSKS